MTTWYAAAAPRRRVPFWAKAVLTVAAVASLGAALFVAAVVVSFNGGLDDVLDVRKPTRDSTHVVRAGEASVAALPGRLSAVTAGVPGTTGVTFTDGGCTEGQHNWKIDDTFDIDCTATLGEVVATPGSDTDSVAARITAVAAAVGAGLDSSWAPAEVSYGDEARWTTGPEETAGVLEVVVRELTPGTPLAEQAVAAGARYPLVVVQVTERYAYE
jgi:hypothetical protein